MKAPGRESDVHTRLGRKLRARFDVTLEDENRYSAVDVKQSDLMRRVIERGLAAINGEKPKGRQRQIEEATEARAAEAKTATW